MLGLAGYPMRTPAERIPPLKTALAQVQAWRGNQRRRKTNNTTRAEVEKSC
jgi:hypothetical protein